MSKGLIFWHAFSIYSANVTTVRVLHSRFLQSAQTLCNYKNHIALIRSVPLFKQERAETCLKKTKQQHFFPLA